MLTLKKIHRIALGLILFLLLLGSRAYADDTSLGRTPEGVFPINEQDVVMESEEITVDMEKRSVECSFVFHNTGADKNVLMGFPGKGDHDPGDNLTNQVNLEIKKFKAYINGKELTVTHEKTDDGKNAEYSHELGYSEYFTFTVPFKADGKVTVKNTYLYSPTYDSMGSIFTGYVLKTGAMWKAAIGSAKITFRLGVIKPYHIRQMEPGGFKFEGNALVWERKEFEPEYDLSVVYNTYQYSKEYLSGISEEEAEKIKRKINSFNEIGQLADKGNTDTLLALYNEAFKEKDYVLAAYISSYLPDLKVPEEKLTIDNITIEKISDRYGISCDTSGLMPVSRQTAVSHTENGRVIQDSQDSFVKLTPGIGYSITCTAKDWLGREVQKTVKFTPPSESSDESEAARTDSPAAVQPAAQSPNESSGISAAVSEAKQGAHFSGIVAIALLSTGVAGIAVAAAIILFKKKRR